MKHIKYTSNLGSSNNFLVEKPKFDSLKGHSNLRSLSWSQINNEKLQVNSKAN